MKRFTGLLTACALVCAAQLAAESSSPDFESRTPKPRTANPRTPNLRIPDGSRIPDPDPTSDAETTHVLNRLTFGARPADIERMHAVGLPAWIDEQLNPARLDDHAVEAMLPPLERPPDGADPKDLRRFAKQHIQALASDKLLRAMYSERQLQEVLTDFWFNHFNVYAGKGRTAVFLADYEQNVIRPHVFDRFRDLLEADAKSPAMLFYLDNWMSTADADAGRDSGSGIRDPKVRGSGVRGSGVRGSRVRGSRVRRGIAPAAGAAGKKRARGLNENYGRELLELHTLGVDGGYTQQDVINVARAFTGWTIDRDGHFLFVPALHDSGEKTVLGHTIKAGGGIDDGEKVLDILASHPATAHHIAFELTQRLVADDPPAALVDRAAARFRETGGNLREVVKTIVTAPEFQSAAAVNAKFKTPFELVVSAVRTTGATVTDARAFVQTLQQLGEPLYLCQPPIGYHDTADAWVSAGGLVTRMNFATRFASGHMPGVTLPDNATPSGQLALHLASPEFQRH